VRDAEAIMRGEEKGKGGGGLKHIHI